MNQEPLDSIPVTPIEEPTVTTKKTPKKSSFLNFVIYVLSCYFIAMILTTYVFSMAKVEGSSMCPTLNENADGNCDATNVKTSDWGFFDRLFFKYSGISRFDIVIVDGTDYFITHEDIVKRVIGLPGEEVRYEQGILKVDGTIIEETFLDEDIKLATGDFVITLAEDEFFVMGDNRMNSYDSREIGPIHRTDIIGRGLLRFYRERRQLNQIIDRELMFPHVVS